MLSGDRSLSWGCSQCRGPDFAEGDELRKQRGCEGKPVESLGFEFDPSLRQCPWSVVDSDTWALLQWWSDWVAFKVLPWGGSDLMTQPAYVLEVLEICETEKRRAETKEHKKQQARKVKLDIKK